MSDDGSTMAAPTTRDGRQRTHADRDLGAARTLLRAFEGAADADPTSVNLVPYLCPAGYWTIGWGHVVRSPDGALLRGRGLRARARAVYPRGLTREDAETLLADDIRTVAAGVEALVPRTLHDARFCALLSFAFGAHGGIAALKTSALLRRVLAGRHVDAAGEFMAWTQAGTPRRTVRGLVRRRAVEAFLYATGTLDLTQTRPPGRHALFAPEHPPAPVVDEPPDDEAPAAIDEPAAESEAEATDDDAPVAS